MPQFTGLIPMMAGLMYEEKLSTVGTVRVVLRKMRGVCTETYSIFNVLRRVDAGMKL